MSSTSSQCWTDSRLRQQWRCLYMWLLSHYSSETVRHSVTRLMTGPNSKSKSLIRNLQLNFNPEVELRHNRACAMKILRKMAENVIELPKFGDFYRKSGLVSPNLMFSLCVCFLMLFCHLVNTVCACMFVMCTLIKINQSIRFVTHSTHTAQSQLT